MSRHVYSDSEPSARRNDQADRSKQDGMKDKTGYKRISPAVAEKAKELTVKSLDLLDGGQNSKKHHTAKYGAKVQPVLRRGQEFNITVTFDRDYRKKTDDLSFIVKADKEDTSKNLYAEFQLDEVGSATYKTDGGWGARIVEEVHKTMKVEIYIPGDCVVGQWALEVKTSLLGQQDDFIYECQQPLFVLFNPWSAADQVHFTEDKELLKEYVLNDSGTFYYGVPSDIGSRSWIYGQFQPGILEICMSILKKSFDAKMTASMGDPVLVTRALSKIVNSEDDNGVLVGNWTGSFGGGKPPTYWTSSTEILRLYEKSGTSVLFGQCWVFSHVLTAVCRALGLPSRSVTNFASAHDTDFTCTIDYYRTEDGDVITKDKKDSVWNFHVWNEVWICRPDLGGTYDGWHAIDATPQERSAGMFQCGPCPVEAVKRGEITVGYDTAFVFSEVNANKVFWVEMDDNTLVKAGVKTDAIGKKISTKPPTGKPHKENLTDSNQNDPSLRMDLTLTYKYKEGSKEEEEAVERAIRRGVHGERLYGHNNDLKVEFEPGKRTVLGKDLVVTVSVTNVTNEDKTVRVFLAFFSCQYWTFSSDDKLLVKEKHPEQTIKAGQKVTFQVKVTEAQYRNKIKGDLSMYGYACATDVKARMPHAAFEDFMLSAPSLMVEGPKTAMPGEAVTVTVSFTNDQGSPLTMCSLSFMGTLQLDRDDLNPVESFFGQHVLQLKDIPPYKSVSVRVRLVGQPEQDDEDNTKMMQFTFKSRLQDTDISITSDNTYVLDLVE